MTINWQSPSERRALAELIEPEEYSRQWAAYRDSAGQNVAERWVGVLSLLELQMLGRIVAAPGRMYCHTWDENNLADRHLIEIAGGKCTATMTGRQLLDMERDRWRKNRERRHRKA